MNPGWLTAGRRSLTASSGCLTASRRSLTVSPGCLTAGRRSLTASLECLTVIRRSLTASPGRLTANPGSLTASSGPLTTSRGWLIFRVKGLVYIVLVKNAGMLLSPGSCWPEVSYRWFFFLSSLAIFMECLSELILFQSLWATMMNLGSGHFF